MRPQRFDGPMAAPRDESAPSLFNRCLTGDLASIEHRDFREASHG
jgi:hypothetical protein